MTFEKVFLQVHQLSDQINELFDIDPDVRVKISPESEINGTCWTTYQRTNMYIEVNIPADIKLTKRVKNELNAVVLHEYCHYIDAYELKGPERFHQGNLYEWFNDEKMKDEKKTWRQTKRLAEALGLWDRNFFNAIQAFTYVSDLQYK